MQWEERTCEIHGDRAIVECRLCGQEFCALCAGGRTVCPDCADDDWDDEIEDGSGEEPDEDADPDLDGDDEDETTKAG